MAKISMLVILLGLGATSLTGSFIDGVKEGKCKQSDILSINPETETHIDWIKEQDKKGWYYVMDSKHHAAILHRALTGEDPIGPDSFKTACYIYKKNEGKIQIIGFSAKKAIYDCLLDSRGRNECRVNMMSSHPTHASARGTSDSTVIWTDGKKYALTMRCSGTYKVWSLRSTVNEPVDSETRNKVIEHITKEGFDPTLAMDLPRDGCPTIDE